MAKRTREATTKETNDRLHTLSHKDIEDIKTATPTSDEMRLKRGMTPASQ
jgi:hypothetical protein